MEAFEWVKSLLQARYPGAGVHLFGSVANGLSVRHNNDIDVCLELEGVDDQVGLPVGQLPAAAAVLLLRCSCCGAQLLAPPECASLDGQPLPLPTARLLRRLVLSLQAGKAEVAGVVGELMEAAGMAEVLPLPKARVPVVKFVVPRTGTKVGHGARLPA